MARQDKKAMWISALVFFAAVAVVAWFGISGFQPATDEKGQPVPQLIYAGGAPTQAAKEERAPVDESAAEAEDEYVIGEYGDPADQLYADESEGEWGEAALESATRFLTGTSDSGRGRTSD